MGEAVENFEILVRHGALCSRLEVESLVDSYRAMEPALHRHCGTPDVVDIEALLYFSDRLPTNIYLVQQILIQADVPDKLPQMAGILRLETTARRRPVFQVGNDTLIVVAREGRTELLDLITLLCGYQIEAKKISDLLNSSALVQTLTEVLEEGDAARWQKRGGVAAAAAAAADGDDSGGHAAVRDAAAVGHRAAATAAAAAATAAAECSNGGRTCGAVVLVYGRTAAGLGRRGYGSAAAAAHADGRAGERGEIQRVPAETDEQPWAAGCSTAAATSNR